MTVASEITRIEGNISAAYTAADAKGATMPATENSDNLATCIGSIDVSPVISSLSITPTTSSQTITAPSGTDGYSPIDVAAVTSSIDANITAGNIKKDVSILGVTGTYEGSVGIPRRISNGVFDQPRSDFTFSLPSEVNCIHSYALSHAFLENVNTVAADFSNIVIISGTSALENAFYHNTRLASVDFSNLTTISGSRVFSFAFSGSILTEVSFPKLTNISTNQCLNHAFVQCGSLANVYFNALTTASFGSYTNQFDKMLNDTGTTVTHTIHFPSNLESTIQGLTGYPTFGGTSGYVTLAFDLPATS